MLPETLRSTDSHELDAFRWKSRVILLSCPNIEDPAYRQQAAELIAEFPALIERDLIVLTSGAEAFEIKLIGKDGGTKLSSRTVVPAASIFALIDSMPMRRAEMNARDQTD